VRERFSVPEWVCWLRRHYYLPKKNNFLTQVSFLSLGWWGRATIYEQQALLSEASCHSRLASEYQPS
jgi:hypothetical protein